MIYFKSDFLDEELIEEGKKIYKNHKEDLDFLSKSYSENHIDELLKVGKEFRDKSDVFILVGVGGSNGSARAIIEGLDNRPNTPEILYMGNDLSPVMIKNALKIIKSKDVTINVIAKNFKTLEPGLHFRILRKALESKYGIEEASKRIAVTGTPGGELDIMAKSEGYYFLEFEKELTGRFSAFHNVCLFPLAVMGFDIRSYLNAKENYLKNLECELEKVLQYVSYRQKNYRDGKKIEILSSGDLAFSFFNKWWVQLFGESEGTKKLGIYPDSMCFSEDLHSMGQFIQAGSPEFMETFLRVENYEDFSVPKSRLRDGFEYLDGLTIGDINKEMMEATLEAHKIDDTPVSEIILDKLDLENFSELFLFFMHSVIISSYMTGVSPFEQYGVEAYKERMFDRLENKER